MDVGDDTHIPDLIVERAYFCVELFGRYIVARCVDFKAWCCTFRTFWVNLIVVIVVPLRDIGHWKRACCAEQRKQTC